jgi:16S rRNA (uracil1498-N3)-methyltransferase
MRRIRVDELPEVGGRVVLDAAATHRVTHVLRLPAGARVALFDGRGHEGRGHLVVGDAGRCEVALDELPREARPPGDLHLLFGVPKGAALDNVLRMSVECGVTHLHPLLTRRTVPKGDHADRWARIAEAASTQCGRADVPVVYPLRSLREAVAALPQGLDRFVGVPGGPPAANPGLPGAFCVGPEGGLAPDELELTPRSLWACRGGSTTEATPAENPHG